MPPISLSRFLTAQSASYPIALAEMKNGRDDNFAETLKKYFGGRRDGNTLRMLEKN